MEIPVDNSDNDKQNALGKLLSRTADCGSALRQRFPNRDTLVAIPDRAERFVVAQHAIALANAPAHVAMCARFHHDRLGRYLLDLTALSSQVCFGPISTK